MLIDFAGSDLPQQTFDIAIVGAGAVGLSMAAKLARAGRRVILLEAGPSSVTDQSQSYFRTARATGHELPGLHIGRFRSLGGTTNFWGGQLVEFDQATFETRNWLGAPGWPIDLSDITENYREAFELMEMPGVLSDEQVWSQLSVSPPPQTHSVRSFFTRWVPQKNFATLFSGDIRTSDTLMVVVNAQVVSIETDDAGRVLSVQVGDESGRRASVSASNFVLANGTIEISRLLLTPSSKGGSHPWEQNKWLGRSFMDHVDCYAGTLHLTDKKRFLSLFENAVLGGVKYVPKLRLSQQAQRTSQIGDVGVHFVFRTAMAENVENLKIFARGLLRGRLNVDSLRNPMALLGSLRFALPMALRYLRYRRVGTPMDAGIQLRVTAEQRPVYDSRITLRDERDIFGLPLVDVDWRIDEKDIETLAVAAEAARDYLQQQGLAQVDLEPALLARDPAFLAIADDANHQMGGARMANTPELGVVDGQLRVFGTSNLFVAGAAVFPSTGFANPTFTAIALGLRLADHLLHIQETADA